MEKENTVKYKSERFAIRIINMYKHLIKKHREYEIMKQILRSGTSIGANLAEAECAISKKDFLNKVYIALKECSETIYWLKLLHETNYLSESEFKSLMVDSEELKRMLMATTKTTSKSLKQADHSTLNSQHSTLKK